MDQSVVNLLIGSVMAVFGWVFRTIWSELQIIKKEHATSREDLAKNYVLRNDFKELATEIRSMFQTISDKLDKKADK